MQEQTPAIDVFLFGRQFERFRAHVIKQSGLDIVSFNSNPYTEQQEGYKYDIHRNGRKMLNFGTWRESDISTGKIARAVIAAIELENNNLVQWQPRYGDDARPHHALHVAVNSSSGLEECEKALYRLYRGAVDAAVFDDLISFFGKKYALIAYLFFLKDRGKYMPIAPTYFDRAFKSLGTDFVTSHSCSWQNYMNFNGLLAQVRDMLDEQLRGDEQLSGEVSLLDAHSFVWILSGLLGDTEEPPDVLEYKNLSTKEREAITKARVGQGIFRGFLIKYWVTCAVTSCREPNLLTASHIKPWRDCDLKEAVDPYNGLLLSPSLNAAFDAGYISFADSGKVIISHELSDADAKALGLESSLCLRRVESQHKPYLDYHRKVIFKNGRTGQA